MPCQYDYMYLYQIQISEMHKYILITPQCNGDIDIKTDKPDTYENHTKEYYFRIPYNFKRF